MENLFLFTQFIVEEVLASVICFTNGYKFLHLLFKSTSKGKGVGINLANPLSECFVGKVRNVNI